MVPGALLAAGRSSRMGRAKALLPAGDGGPTFVRRLSDVFRRAGIADILVVGRPEDEPLRTEVATLGIDVRYIENAHAEEGQISSIVAAAADVDRAGVDGLLVLPVDQPLVEATTVAALLGAFSRTGAAIVRAGHGGRHGHPVIFARGLFGDLARADRRLGAKAVLTAHHSEIVDVEVADEGVLIDIDDPAAYARVFGCVLSDAHL
jgi:molybdenum cofactor cytidylyltransferase